MNEATHDEAIKMMPTGRLRFVARGSQKMLQQEWKAVGEFKTEWQDVPLVGDEPRFNIGVTNDGETVSPYSTLKAKDG